jgi:predicted DNA-binding transcriptional regulator AlpA
MTTSKDNLVLLTPKEAAALLRISKSWLAKARMRQDGPPFIKVSRSVRYEHSDVVAWLRRNQR